MSIEIIHLYSSITKENVEELKVLIDSGKVNRIPIFIVKELILYIEILSNRKDKEGDEKE
jgi:hypothetical protein